MNHNMKCDESNLGPQVETSPEMDVETAQTNPALDTKQCEKKDKLKDTLNKNPKASEDSSMQNVVDNGLSFVESPLPLERDSCMQPPLKCLVAVDCSSEESVQDATECSITDNDFEEGGLVNSRYINKDVLTSGSYVSKHEKLGQRRTQDQSNTYRKRRKLSDPSIFCLEPIKEDEVTPIPESGVTIDVLVTCADDQPASIESNADSIGECSSVLSNPMEQENIYITVQNAVHRDKVINESTSNDNENFCNNSSQCHPSCKLLEQKNVLMENIEEEEQSGSKLTPVVKDDVDLITTNKGNATHGPLSSPERTLICRSSKKLLILDVNGLLADIVPSASYLYAPDIIISGKEVFKRPFCKDFLNFCFERFNVGVWSSRTRRNVDLVLNFLMGDLTGKLLFCWDQSHCTDTGFKTITHKDKPLHLKELKKLWEKHDHDLPWEKGEYDESNTLLLDDSPYKALRNPAHTAIFPRTYRYNNTKDCSLGPAGDLRLYLERLATCEHVQDYVKENPFGQRSITESNLSWSFYRKIVSNEHEVTMEESSAVTDVEK